MKKMDRVKKFPSPGILGLIAVAVAMWIHVAGCTGPRQIVAPDAKEITISNTGQSERDGLTLRAAILDEKQVRRLLSVDVASRAVIPLLFVMSNRDENLYLIRREHFTLRIDQLRLEPALPGRAAMLLRDSSRSQGAAWAGYLVFGIFAAPSIAAAEKKEDISVEGNREIIFSEATLPPGSTIAGYLFFESHRNLGKIQGLKLELRISGDAENQISVQLSNPYTKGGPVK